MEPREEGREGVRLIPKEFALHSGRIGGGGDKPGGGRSERCRYLEGRKTSVERVHVISKGEHGGSCLGV